CAVYCYSILTEQVIDSVSSEIQLYLRPQLPTCSCSPDFHQISRSQQPPFLLQYPYLNNEKLPIGIFSSSGDEWPWFHKLLKTRLPGDEVKHIQYRKSSDKKKTKPDLWKCSFYIFLVTNEWPSDPNFIALYEEKNVLAEERNVLAEERNVQAEVRNVQAEERNIHAEERNVHAEERNVLAVIDVEGTSRIRIFQKRPSHFDRLDTVKVTKGEKSIYETFFRQSDEAVARIHKQLFELEELVSGRVNDHKIREEEKHRESGFVDQKTDSSSVMGIFSRSAESDYEWLQVLLRSESFRDQIQVVRSFYISNNKMAQFVDDVRQCKFGILYHTQNRGRINITDVTDSLYDEELEIMSAYLGSHNVLVVADDLNDSSDEEKQRILESQPKIQKFAADLLLVAETEKEDETCLLKKLKGVNLFKSENVIMLITL
uniref:Uncharacterized protein n=1 Tax=Leptobrachium leishanense TaxID=445787 RepID=A0A8C5PRK5_9ANUR